MRRSLAVIASVAVLGAALPAPAHAATLNDIAGHWARTQIQSGVNDGYISGFPDGSFKPDQPITRAEFFKLLAAAVKLKPQPSMVAPFSEKSHWSMQQGQIQAAVSGGLLFPPDYGASLGPDTKISRQEMVLAAVRAVGKQGLVGHIDLVVPDAATYPDWLQDWAAVAISDGILTGYEDGSIKLQRTATRAEALVIVQRVLKQVGMNLTASTTEGAPNIVRHPAEGEPVWAINATEESPRPSFSDGTHTYTVDADLRGFWLLPAPGKAAWLQLVMEDGDVVYRLKNGAMAEVGRYANGATLLAVDAGGRLWFSHGTELIIADGSGVTATIPMGDRLLSAEIDWQGNLYGASLTRLYKVSAAGQTEQMTTGLTGSQQIRRVAAAEDGSVWLMVTGSADGSRVEAIRLQHGQVVQRVPLLGRYFGGDGRPVQAAVLGSAGPVRWVIALAEGGSEAERQESLFKFDLETGAFTRLVAPRSAGSSTAVVPAPDGGALLRDSAGKFWRVMP